MSLHKWTINAGTRGWQFESIHGEREIMIVRVVHQKPEKETMSNTYVRKWYIKLMHYIRNIITIIPTFQVR